MKRRAQLPMLSPVEIWDSEGIGWRPARPCGDIKGARTGFSLVEVIIAVGIFSVAVVGTLGLLPALTRSVAESADALVAQRLPGALESELRRSAAEAGFDTLATSIPIATTPLENGTAFVASRDGARLVPIADSASLIAAGDAYYLVELWRFPAEPLAFAAGSAVLALRARVSWPYRLGTDSVTPLGGRRQFSFNLAINR